MKPMEAALFSKKPDLIKRESMATTEYTVAEAIKIYLQKRQLVNDVFENLGSEYYIEISTFLHNKCFVNIDNDEIPRHIMHRALIGTTIDDKNEDGKFLYDKCDEMLEKILINMKDVDSCNEAIKLINTTQL